MNTIQYLLEASICWALFYGFYVLFVSRDTFFRVNRGYLLGTMILGLIIPTLQILPRTTMVENSIATVYLDEITVTVTRAVEQDSWWVWSWQEVLLSFYLLVCLVLSIRLLIGMGQIFRLWWGSTIYRKEDFILVETNKKHAPFSFFRFLFMSSLQDLKGAERDQILKHEAAHISGWHSLDVVTAEILTIFFWFNPVLFLYKKSIREVHEYLADAAVLQTTPKASYGRLLIEQALPGLRLANNFNHSQLKKRIEMMTKIKSKNSALLKYMIALPLLCGALVFFSCQDQHLEDENLTPCLTKKVNAKNAADVYQAVEFMPRFPGCEEEGKGEDDKKACSQQKMLEFIYKNITYPKAARDAGKEGIVVASFVVDKQGDLQDVEILREIGFGTSEEVLGIISKMPNWIPGRQNGSVVKVRYNLPVKFKLQ